MKRLLSLFLTLTLLLSLCACTAKPDGTPAPSTTASATTTTEPPVPAVTIPSLPSSGKPIIMLGDRQTTGGYTKIANVITADFRILAQLKQGDKVRFEKVSVKAAQDALLTQRAALRTIRSALEA